MLSSSEALNLDIDCPVDATAGEYACVRISNIRLDINKIQELVEPILKKLVNPPDDDEIFDRIAKPLTYLDERIPGLSDALGEDITVLDIAETFMGRSSGVTTIRVILALWRSMRTLAQLFNESNEDGVLIAERYVERI